MPFEPGHKKIGGRKPGTPNKATLPIAELCAFHNCSPIEILIKMANDNKDKNYQFQAARELASYLYPKRKALEVTITDIPDEDFDKEVERRINERRPSAKVSER